jgi:CspA family cold shock protein
MSQRLTGTVKWFDASKGYGYIDAGIDEEVFVYYQSLNGNGFRNLLSGDRVEFSLARRPRGPEALDVARLN